MAKWLEIMRTGVFKDRHGIDRNITQDIINAVANNHTYDASTPDKNAPLTVGHITKERVPGFGVVEALKVVGDKLLALPGQVVPEFAALVRKGGFPDVSAGLNEAMDKLTHLAFLSAEKPAIDGLKPVAEFSCNNTESRDVTITVTDIVKGQLPEFSTGAENWLQWRINQIGSLFRNFKNYLIDKEGQEKADTMLPEYELNQLVLEIPSWTEKQPEFAAPAQDEFSVKLAESESKVAELTAKNTELSAKLAEFSTAESALRGEITQLKAVNTEFENKIKEFQIQVRNAEFSSFVETLINEGKVLPDQKQATIAKLETMHKATPAEFSSADGSESPLTVFKTELQSRPVIAPPLGKTKLPEFSAGNDGNNPVIHGERARQYIAEQKSRGVTVDVLTALEHVKNNG